MQKKKNFLQYLSALLGAIDIVAIVTTILSSAPEALADEPLDGNCLCPNGGPRDMLWVLGFAVSRDCTGFTALLCTLTVKSCISEDSEPGHT